MVMNLRFKVKGISRKKNDAKEHRHSDLVENCEECRKMHDHGEEQNG